MILNWTWICLNLHGSIFQRNLCVENRTLKSIGIENSMSATWIAITLSYPLWSHPYQLSCLKGCDALTYIPSFNEIWRVHRINKIYHILDDIYKQNIKRPRLHERQTMLQTNSDHRKELTRLLNSPSATVDPRHLSPASCKRENSRGCSQSRCVCCGQGRPRGLRIEENRR